MEWKETRPSRGVWRLEQVTDLPGGDRSSGSQVNGLKTRGEPFSTPATPSTLRHLGREASANWVL